MYKCGNCKELIRIDVTLADIQCEKCGSKIFYKERPNVKKIVRSR